MDTEISPINPISTPMGVLSKLSDLELCRLLEGASCAAAEGIKSKHDPIQLLVVAVLLRAAVQRIQRLSGEAT